MQRDSVLLGEIRALYEEADQAAEAFRMSSGWSCPNGCSHCCESSAIETMPIEFVLAADRLLKQEWFLPSIRVFVAEKKTVPSPCPLYVSLGFGRGLCSVYEDRALICRLFGFASNTDENGRVSYHPCEFMRASGPGESREEAPVYRDFSVRLARLKPLLGAKMPIGNAILSAAEYLAKE